MIVREQFEYFLAIKHFNVINFCLKGYYSLKVSFYFETKSGVIIPAYSYLSKEKQISTNKIIKNSFFQTDTFFITFSQQKASLKSQCFFKIQNQCKSEGKLFMTFELIQTAYRYEKNDRQTRLVDKLMSCQKKMYQINTKKTFGQFEKIIFDDPDYFSSLDCFICGQNGGYQLRKNSIQLKQFLQMKSTIEEDIDSNKQQLKLLNQAVELLQKNISSDLYEYYTQMIIKNIKSYKQIVQILMDLKPDYFLLKGNKFINAPPQLLPFKDFQFYMIKYISFDRFQKISSKQQILLYFQLTNQNQVRWLIYQTSILIKQNFCFLWNKLTQYIIKINSQFQKQAQKYFKKQNNFHIKQLMKFNLIDNKDKQALIHQFKDKKQKLLLNENIRNVEWFYHPLLTFENFKKEQKKKGFSLIVCVHGYQGMYLDMQKIRNFLQLHNPACHVYLAKSLNDQDETIQTLGQKLAQEVANHIMLKGAIFTQISFIGYSLGGIIVRQALKSLTPYKDRMNIFMSFGSPHVGVRDGTNFFVKMGIWFMTRSATAKNLRQLNFQTEEDEEDPFMSKLAKDECIGWFKKVVLVSAKEDHFVPYGSSRLDEVLCSEETGLLCHEIKKKLQRLQRVDVWFDVSHKTSTVDKLSGRRSHIEFLQCGMFLNTLFQVYGLCF